MTPLEVNLLIWGTYFSMLVIWQFVFYRGRKLGFINHVALFLGSILVSCFLYHKFFK